MYGRLLEGGGIAFSDLFLGPRDPFAKPQSAATAKKGGPGITCRSPVVALYAIIRHMKRTTVFLDEATSRELQLLAQREKLPVAALVRDALGRYLGEAKHGKGLRLRFLGTGRSGHHDTAERAEEVLWGDLQPHSSAPRPQRKRRGRR